MASAPLLCSPRTAGPQPRDVLRLALLLCSPRTAGPQPRDVLRLALIFRSPRTAGPQPRDVLRLALLFRSPRTAGPQPRDVLRLALLPEPAGDVVLGPLVARVREERARHAELDQLPQEHEARGVGHAGRLLHVVGHDDDRVAVLQLEHQLLDLRRGDGIQGRARLVHQEHVRLDRDRAGDAEPLLLPAREPERALAEAVLDLVPERDRKSTRLNSSHIT